MDMPEGLLVVIVVLAAVVGLPSALAGGALLLCPLAGAGVLPAAVMPVLGGGVTGYGGLLLALAVAGRHWVAGLVGGLGVAVGLLLLLNQAGVRL
jgi:hypothetical protein